jgi:hypothetical protein
MTNISGDLDVPGELIARKDLSVSGDLYVNGKEYINDSETAQTTDDYLVLRHNQTTSLGTNEYSGVAVHNYTQGKTATITTDKDGTWRVADNTETDTNYTNISYYDGVYYTELTRTTTTVISGMKTTFDEDELDECVYYNTSYYHFDGNNWFPVSLVDNKLTLGSVITDSTVIAALNALTREDLIYFRSLTVTVINPVENQPLLTRDEAANLTNGQALTWDATNQKAIGKTIDTTVTQNSDNLVTSGAVYEALQGTIPMQVVFDTSHPVGETYTQYPEQLDPVSLYNQNGIQSTWTLLDFGGAFFRAEGGNALAFNNSKEVTAVSGAVLTIPNSGASVGCLIYDPVGNETRTVTAVSGNNVTVDSAFTSTDLTNVLIGQSSANLSHRHGTWTSDVYNTSGTRVNNTGGMSTHSSGSFGNYTSNTAASFNSVDGSTFTLNGDTSAYNRTVGWGEGGGSSYRKGVNMNIAHTHNMQHIHSISADGETEARPVNMTVRVWKRTD